MIDIYARHQNNFYLHDLYPTLKGVCCCGCGKKLTGRKTRWANKDCIIKPLIVYSIIKGNTGTIRNELLKRDKGVCAICGKQDLNWEADHIIPVAKGGGGCSLNGFQTLCYICHKVKTRLQNYKSTENPFITDKFKKKIDAAEKKVNNK